MKRSSMCRSLHQVVRFARQFWTVIAANGAGPAVQVDQLCDEGSYP
jgi:hypothetical protein